MQKDSGNGALFLCLLDAARCGKHTSDVSKARTWLARRPGTGRWLWHALLYGALLSAAAFALEWIDYRHRAMIWSTGFYVLVVALGFACLGGWVGHRLTARPHDGSFVPNQAAIATLAISAREVEVLGLLAEGCANKVVARRLGISPNTVKTHVARLFEKLEVSSRTQAIAQARALGIIA